jgi:hypothetical protein
VLTTVELRSAGVGQEAIEAPGDVTKMEAEARRTVWPQPERSARDAHGRTIEVLSSLHERVGSGLQQRVDPFNWSSKPGFGHV